MAMPSMTISTHSARAVPRYFMRLVIEPPFQNLGHRIGGPGLTDHIETVPYSQGESGKCQALSLGHIEPQTPRYLRDVRGPTLLPFARTFRPRVVRSSERISAHNASCGTPRTAPCSPPSRRR